MKYLYFVIIFCIACIKKESHQTVRIDNSISAILEVGDNCSLTLKDRVFLFNIILDTVTIRHLIDSKAAVLKDTFRRSTTLEVGISKGSVSQLINAQLLFYTDTILIINNTNLLYARISMIPAKYSMNESVTECFVIDIHKNTIIGYYSIYDRKHKNRDVVIDSVGKFHFPKESIIISQQNEFILE